jgi:radical SAM superfamily enzyme YgiQ (UPF0313 family)
MRVLLVSTYELGHQPLHVAAPAAALRADGHDVRCLDLSVQPWDDAAVDWAEAVAFSVPMHTAMRLALRAARAVRDRRPDLPVCLYGLYAPVSRDVTVGRLADAVFAGTYEPALRAWVGGLAGAPTDPPPMVSLERPAPLLPARELLPPLERYAHLAIDGQERQVGYVEATTGCLHTCRHCPVPTVYGGRFRAVDRDAVLADIDQLVAAGARHITFGDPDFLNGPAHAARLVADMHANWPELTFDCTTKVDHILDHAGVWAEFARSGCLFVVSAFETTNDAVLQRLRKGHTSAQAAAVVSLLRDHGIEPRPSWLPFTPWTTHADVVDMLDFIITHDLIGNVEPVQLTIRLLLPEGSLLLDDPDLVVDGYDPDALTHTWTSPLDPLQRDLAQLVEEHTQAGTAAVETLMDINALVRGERGQIEPGSTAGRPRLTEPWFC